MLPSAHLRDLALCPATLSSPYSLCLAGRAQDPRLSPGLAVRLNEKGRMSAGAVTPLFKQLLFSPRVSHQQGHCWGAGRDPAWPQRDSQQNINSALDIYCQLEGEKKELGVCPRAEVGTLWRFWKVPEKSKATL